MKWNDNDNDNDNAAMPGNLISRRKRSDEGGQEWKILRASRELDGDAQYNTLNRPDINTQRQSHWQDALTWHFWNSRNLAGPFYQLFWKGFKYPTFLPTSTGYSVEVRGSVSVRNPIIIYLSSVL